MRSPFERTFFCASHNKKNTGKKYPMSLKQQYLDSFIDMLGQFLSACEGVWPECNGLKEYRTGFDVVNSRLLSEDARLAAKEKIIDEYYTSLKPYFSRCSAKDPTVFTEESIPILEKVSIREKYLDQGIPDATRDVIWQYVLQLNQLCQIYNGLLNKIPSNVMNKVQETAMRIRAQIDSGTLDLNSLDVKELGKEVMSDLPEEEVETFINNFMQDPSSLAEIATNLGGIAGIDTASLMQQVMQGQASGGGGDSAAIAMAMQMFLQQQQ